MTKGLVLYHNCLEIFEILNLEKVRAKYAAWDKFAVTSTDIISAKGSSVADPLGTGASAFPYMVEGTRNAVTTAAVYDSLIKDYLSAQNGKEARLTIMYGAGDKDCLAPVCAALMRVYKENPSFDLKLLKLEVVTCRYSGDLFVPHSKELGTTAYKSQESQGKKLRRKRSPQNDLIKLCSDHKVPFCLKYPVCYVNPGVFVKEDEIISTDEIAYFQNYSQVTAAPIEESSGRYAMKVRADFLTSEDEIIEGSRKRPGVKVGFYNQHYFDYVEKEKRDSIEARLIGGDKKSHEPALAPAAVGSFGVGAGGIAEVGAGETFTDKDAEDIMAEIKAMTLVEVATEKDLERAESEVSYSPKPASVDRLEAPPALAKKGKA